MLGVGCALGYAALAMNSALEKLYDDLINEADKEPPEEITEAERAKRFLAEKQVTIEKLKEARSAYVCLCVPSVLIGAEVTAANSPLMSLYLSVCSSLK